MFKKAKGELVAKKSKKIEGLVETIPVVVAGQYYYVEHRRKYYSEYEVEVDLPVEEKDRALAFIQRNLVVPKLKKLNPDRFIQGFRTCALVSHIPGVNVEEEAEEILIDEPSAAAETLVDNEEFLEIEEMI